jgi:pilus assembly protein CpaC
MCTNNNWFLRSVLVGVTLLTVIPFKSVSAQPQTPQTGNQPVSRNEAVSRINAPKTRLQLVERSARILQLYSRIKLVDGFDPEVLEVTSINDEYKVRVRALKSGVTSMTIVDDKDVSFTIEFYVVGDVRHLQVTIDRLFPNSSVQAVKVADSVVLKGWVTQPEHITNIVEIAEQFFGTVLNHMRVGGGQQVMLKVKVMEVQRSKIRRLGINFYYLNQDAFLTNTVGQLSTVASTTLPFGGPPGVSITPALLADSNFIGGLTNNSSVFQSYVQALKEESLLKILAEPTLVATNGRPANLLSGGEFPILVPQSLGVIGIEWREFGVRLEAVPILLGNGRLRLELQPEVSERDFSNAVQVQGLTVPGLTSRRVNTQVEMRYGETFVLAGLIASRETAETSKVPVLGDLPWVGAAFRRVRYDNSETELVIMVTPELVAPVPASDIPPGGPGQFTDAPTGRELYIDGMIEIPKYGDRCNSCYESGHVNGAPVQGTDSHIIPPYQSQPTLVTPEAVSPEAKGAPSLPILKKSAQIKANQNKSTLLNSSKLSGSTQKASFWRRKKPNGKRTDLSTLFKSKKVSNTSSKVNAPNPEQKGSNNFRLIAPKKGLIKPESINDPFLDQ